MEKDTDAFLDAMAQFEILDGEKLRVYKQRLEELATQLAWAKPDRAPASDGKKTQIQEGLHVWLSQATGVRRNYFRQQIKINFYLLTKIISKRLNIIHSECKKVEGITIGVSSQKGSQRCIKGKLAPQRWQQQTDQRK